jgi:hypothetical protein
MKRKPRIIITIVTTNSSQELSIIKGRQNHLGVPCAGPTEKQFEIAQQAVIDLLRSE